MFTRSLSRRSFILQSASLVSLTPLVPTMLCRACRAADDISSDPESRVLVVIQLDGGNDGINTVVPYGDDGYGRARDKLRLSAETLHKLNEHVGLHPQMQAAKELFDEGRLSIVQGVGYPNPDRSHFRSMRIWQTALFDEAEHNSYGWLGRALDGSTTASANRDVNAFYVGDDTTPVALWGRRSTALGLSRIEDLALTARLPQHVVESFDNVSHQVDSVREFADTQVRTAYVNADRFQRELGTRTSDATTGYPATELASRLQLISTLLKAGSPARVFYTLQSGYDTHAVQLNTHARLLREFSQGLKAFLDDMRASGLEDRVVVLAFSEFGRRVEENESQGTDHGTAGPVFLAGQPVQGGLVGDTPSLSDLEAGDLKMQVGFQRVYATILDRWLNIPSSSVLGESFETLPLFTA